ncbi:MAG: type III-B CRISPR module RAMP protein Cmr6, partial [Candidatus Aminicenantes bacterium]|nr:type III-B CRISPR module RAMP protein Cmr6 [Candidatus Aminicenantes bacterium]
KIGSLKDLGSQRGKTDSPQKHYRPPTDKKNTLDQDRKKGTDNKYHKKANIGWLFSKYYFKGIEGDKSRLEEIKNNPEREKEKVQIEKKLSDHFDRKNENIIDKDLSNYKAELDLLKLPDQVRNLLHFELTTIYPGLFTGSGIPHETHSKGEFTLGFFFDHTTGLPVIPGSSVKGVLRSAFDHPEYIRFLLKEISQNEYSEDEIKELERQIFEGEKDSGEKNEKGDPKYIPIPFKDRDIFFDAVIVSPGDKKEEFLGSDFITPHKNDEFKDPVPLQFLKVLPGVTFRFQFILHNSLDGRVTAENKSVLFKRILQDIGIGAKTNVGYGKFEK